MGAPLRQQVGGVVKEIYWGGGGEREIQRHLAD